MLDYVFLLQESLFLWALLHFYFSQDQLLCKPWLQEFYFFFQTKEQFCCRYLFLFWPLKIVCCWYGNRDSFTIANMNCVARVM